MDLIDLDLPVHVTFRHWQNGEFVAQELSARVMTDNPGNHSTAIVYLKLADTCRRIGTVYVLPNTDGCVIPDQIISPEERYIMAVYGQDILKRFRVVNEIAVA